MTRGCSWPLSRPSTILGYCCYSSAICGVIHGLLYLFSLQVWTFANWNNGKFVTFANFAKFADHKRFFFTFILLLNFLRYLLAFFFLSNAKFSFAIFAKFVDFWRAFFDFVLFRYERLQNLLFLVLIRYLLKCYSMIAMKILTFEIFATFADFSRPSWPFSV